MKWSCLLGVACLYMGGTFAAVPVDDPVLGPTERKVVPERWCSLGTSISWYNNNVSASSGKFTKGYQTRVMEQIAFAGFVNKGVSGGCLAPTPGLVEPADFYTIEHGINDWGHCTNPGTLDDYVNNTGNGTFAADYRKTIDKIREVNPNAKIIVRTARTDCLPHGGGQGDARDDRCERLSSATGVRHDALDAIKENNDE